MDNSKYEAVRAKIVEACPELMELSFGCKVLIDGGYTPRGEHVVYHKHDEVYEAANIGHTEIMTNDTTSFIRYKKPDYATLREILGHPIRLSHVLRAICSHLEQIEIKGWEGKHLASRFVMDSCGTMSFQPQGNDDVQWDLEKDDLSFQSPEVWNFLFKILCE